MRSIALLCKRKGLISIFDEKLSEVGHSNFEGAQASVHLSFDAVTTAPFAGNGEEVIKYCIDKNIGAINMGLMSNPEFMRESTYIDPSTGNELWKDRLEESLKAGADALVLGGTYNTEDIYFQEFLKRVKDENVLFLVPGIGAQGGDPEKFLEAVVKMGFDPKRFQLNVGRDLMNAPDRKQKARELQKISERWISKYDERKGELKRRFNK